MPSKNNKRGDLYISFTVKYPKTLPLTTVTKVANIFKYKAEKPKENCKKVHVEALHSGNIENFIPSNVL